MQNGRVWVGTLPPDVNISNTATSWAGVHWTMIEWSSLSPLASGRARLMAHELFHRIQDGLGLPATNPANAHLDTREGRTWLQLEWRALRQALARPAASRGDRRRAAEDALIFRAMRRMRFSQAAQEERALEMNEGLAEYTGVKLRGPDARSAEEYAIARISDAFALNSFVRSFAYYSGPAYGLLLDGVGANWRHELTPKNDLGDLLSAAYATRLPTNLGAEAGQRARHYDGEALNASETWRDDERQKQVAVFRAKLVDGPLLLLPALGQFSFSFNPNALVPIDDSRTAYLTLRVTDEWGILEVNDGALLVREGGRVRRVVVAAPAGETPVEGKIKGKGWTLQLAKGWQIGSGERGGDYVARKIQ